MTEPRRRILARREVLIAAALAAACKRTPAPEQNPQPCLAYIPPEAGPSDAGAEDVVEAAPANAGPIDSGVAPKPKTTAAPRPCLTTTAPPPPPPPPKP